MIYGRQTKTADLADKFQDELMAERLKKDSPVMSVRKLAEHFDVSTVTANRILNLLVDRGILYRAARSGTFVKNDPPVVPKIAYAAPLPDPENTDPIKYHASFKLMEHFTELGIEPVLVSYHMLRHPALAERELKKTNGLLVDASFIDDITLKTLWNYPGRIAVIGNTYIESKLSCSQVIPDFTEPLLEFDRFKPFSGYDKILIIRAEHRNSTSGEETVRRAMKRLNIPDHKIEMVSLATSGSVDAYMRAGRYFSEHRDWPENTLIVSMSEYFSQAVREICSHDGKIPDILNFDNLEDYQKNPEDSPYFTSIDRQMGLMACRALDLLCRQLKNPDGEQTILRIPAKLVIRESVKKSSARKRIPHSRKKNKSLFQFQ